ncbi:MAG: glycosyltransferase family 2 protein [Clostridia bacterium]|nr:glycosyltransferase family 2 protein [Clostridia bacterium]
MLFSVCIPVYNTSKYLDECLQSVLCQTEKDYEIVLVDDGSTDNSGEICDRYAAENECVRVIHKENEGLMMTRRRAFREAKGDFFICLDSDDYWISDRVLSRVREMIEKHNCDLVLFNYIVGKENSSLDREIILFDYQDEYIFEENHKQELYEKLLVGGRFNCIWIKAASRRIVDVDVDYSVWKDSLVNSQAEDLFQSLPILDAAQRVSYLKEALYFYRWNPGSISKNVRPDYYYAYRTVYQRVNKYLEKWSFDEEQKNLSVQKQLNTIFSILITDHRQNRALWLKVLRDVAEDEFFSFIWRERDPKHICKYYMLMGRLIIGKHFKILRLTKACVESILRLRNMVFKR